MSSQSDDWLHCGREKKLPSNPWQHLQHATYFYIIISYHFYDRAIVNTPPKKDVTVRARSDSLLFTRVRLSRRARFNSVPRKHGLHNSCHESCRKKKKKQTRFSGTRSRFTLRESFSGSDRFPVSPKNKNAVFDSEQLNRNADEKLSTATSDTKVRCQSGCVGAKKVGIRGMPARASYPALRENRR